MKLILEDGNKAYDIKADVTDEKSVDRAVEEIEKRSGGIHVLFNNAGICIHKRDVYKRQRYTMRDEYIYASALGRIGDQVALHHILPMVYKEEIESITVLGDGQPLTWSAEGDVLLIDTATARKNNIATVLKIKRKNIYM